MRLLLALLLTVAITASAATPSPADQKAAQKAFKQGLKLQKQKRDDEALQKFSEAAKLDPENVEYTTAREVLRQQMVYQHVQSGNQALVAQDRLKALSEFHAATVLDPKNQFALERLRDVFSGPASPPNPHLQIVERSDEIQLRPKTGKQNFHFNGDTRGLLELIARNFGLTAVFDENFSSRPVRFNVDGLEFLPAINLAAHFAKAMWTPLSETEIFFAQDTAENRRQYERMSLRTFYLPDVSTPQEMNEIVAVLRGLFEVRHIVPNPAKSTLTVRAPKDTLDAASAWLDRLASGRPQVLLDVKAYHINHSLLRHIGVKLPLQFEIFHLDSSALQTDDPSLQQLINELLSTGAINQANNATIAALLAQVQAQHANSVLAKTSFAFGGGLTTYGVSVPSASLSLLLQESQVTDLEHITLRVAEGNPATLRIGSRQPIQNAIFSPLFNTPSINNLLTDQSFVAAFPSFSYEDLGITVKATPQVHQGPRAEVTLALEFEFRSISSTSFNGIPVISNRQFTGTVRVPEGEQAAVAGMVSPSEQRSLSGVPGVGNLPILRRAVTDESKNDTEDEILVLVTPYIVRSPDQTSPAELWLPGSL